MLQREITFVDFDDNQVTETFYFNLSKAELVKMQLNVKGGMKTYLETIIKKEDEAAIIEAFDKILLASVGKKVDGKFIKTQEVINNFRFSGAYEVIFLQLLTDAKFSSEFVENVMPKGLIDQVHAQQTSTTIDLPQSPISLTPNLDTPTPDFTKMTDADFAAWRLRQSSPLGI